MDEMIMTMIKEETFDDSSTDTTSYRSDEYFYKDAMTLDAVMRLERSLD